MSDWISRTAPPTGEDASSNAARSLAEGAHQRRGGSFQRVLGIVAGLALSIAATYALPALRALRPWTPGSGYVPFWNVVGREWLGEEKALEAEAAELRELRRRSELAPAASAPPRVPAVKPAPQAVFPPYEAARRVERPKFGIEPPEALDAYYEKLTLVDLGVEGAIARAGQWGDSVLGVDGITSGIRRRLQSRFGDAGHGFHLMDRYHPSYLQQGVQFSGGAGWNGCLIINECRKGDRRYGYGGHVAQSEPWGGAVSTWATTKSGFGSSWSTFELWFARHPRGGKVEITIDRAYKTVLDTRAPALEDGFHMVYLQPGAHRVTVSAVGGGSVRAYGVVLENDGPGVVWDGMALIGGSTRGLRTQDPEHIANQIHHRGLDLIAFMFGGNDLARKYVDLRDSMQPYYDEFAEVIRNFRAGRPKAACLIVSVLDHGQRDADDNIVSKQFAKTLSNAQREVARQNGCGFFDTYEAMGGKGSASRWFRASPRLMSPDLGHPTGAGHELIAGLIANAVLYGYQEFRDRKQGQPLPLPYVKSRAAGAAAQGDSEEAATRGEPAP